jgi:hypothetical protein
MKGTRFSLTRRFRLGENEKARQYLERAMRMTYQSAEGESEDPEEVMNVAINYNNMCVIALNQRNYQEAERAAKRAVTLVEPLIQDALSNTTLKKAGNSFLQ